MSILLLQASYKSRVDEQQCEVKISVIWTHFYYHRS